MSEPEYRVHMEQRHRWGPWAWSATYTYGVLQYTEIVDDGWTRAQVVAKARRRVNRWKAKDQLRAASQASLSEHDL